MPVLPRFPPPFEHRLLKLVCGLPPRMQRVLFGPPPRIDGQVLASDLHTLIKLAAASGHASFTGGLGPEEARVHNRRGAEATKARPPIPMQRIEAHEIPGQGGPLAARLYIPTGLPDSAPAPLLIFFHGGGWVIG